MQFSLLTTILALAAGAAAHAVPPNSTSPWGGGPRPYGSSPPSRGGGGRGGGGGSHRHKACLNETGVDALVAGYTYLLEQPGGADFNETAQAILSDRFVVWSDSILTLSNRSVSCDVGAVARAFSLYLCVSSFCTYITTCLNKSPFSVSLSNIPFDV